MPAKKVKAKKPAVKKKVIKKGTKKETTKSASGTKSGLIVVVIIFIVIGLAILEYMGKNEVVDPVYEQDEYSEETDSDTIRVRPPTLAGEFYSESKRILESEILNYVASANDRLPDHELPAMIVPHAGMSFSGYVAGFAYKAIADQPIQQVIILGPSHNYPIEQVAVTSYDTWRTPLGEATVSSSSSGLVDDQVFVYNDAAFLSENSIEVQIPFIQALFPEAEIIPLAVGSLSEESRMVAADRIGQLLNDQTLLIVSSDLSHYLSAEECQVVDQATIDLILAGEQENMLEIDACGREAILIANLIAQDKGWYSSLLEYQHSGSTTGDMSSVVGYPAIAYTTENIPGAERDNEYEVSGDEDEQEYLLDLARTTIEAYLDDGTIYQPEVPESESLTAITGAFVTLEKDGELRGCIGHTVAQEPLYLAVRDNAIAAATADARFEAVTVEEFEDIQIEVSILSDSEPVDLLFIEPGTDGIILTSDQNSATFLPQVWQDFTNAASFLEALSVKAGLESNAWLDDSTSYQRYSVTAFSEFKE
jgi:MEMO1 family protein